MSERDGAKWAAVHAVLLATVTAGSGTTLTDLGPRELALLAVIVGCCVLMLQGRRLVGPRYFAMHRTGRARLIGLAIFPVLVVALLLESWAAFPLVAVIVVMPLAAIIDTACIWDQLDATPTGAAGRTPQP